MKMKFRVNVGGGACGGRGRGRGWLGDVDEHPLNLPLYNCVKYKGQSQYSLSSNAVLSSGGV